MIGSQRQRAALPSAGSEPRVQLPLFLSPDDTVCAAAISAGTNNSQPNSIAASVLSRSDHFAAATLLRGARLQCIESATSRGSPHNAALRGTASPTCLSNTEPARAKTKGGSGGTVLPCITLSASSVRGQLNSSA